MNQYNGNLRRIFADSPSELFNWLIGKMINGTELIDMYSFWPISGEYINETYRQVCTNSDKVYLGHHQNCEKYFCVWFLLIVITVSSLSGRIDLLYKIWI